MKKTVLFALPLVALMFAVGCKKQEAPVVVQPVATEAAPAATEAAPAAVAVPVAVPVAAPEAKKKGK